MFFVKFHIWYNGYNIWIILFCFWVFENKDRYIYRLESICSEASREAIISALFSMAAALCRSPTFISATSAGRCLLKMMILVIKSLHTNWTLVAVGGRLIPATSSLESQVVKATRSEVEGTWMSLLIRLNLWRLLATHATWLLQWAVNRHWNCLASNSIRGSSVLIALLSLSKANCLMAKPRRMAIDGESAWAARSLVVETKRSKQGPLMKWANDCHRGVLWFSAFKSLAIVLSFVRILSLSFILCSVSSPKRCRSDLQ